MDKVIQFNNRTVGRDKLARLFQYASRLIWDLMKRNNLNANSVNTFKNLEYVLSNFRKLLRLGRFIDTLYSASNLMHHEDVIIKVNCTLSKIAYGLYLFCDHIIFLGRVGLADVDLRRWGRVANKYWLLNIVMNLVRDFVEIKRLVEDKKMKLKFNEFKPLCKYVSNFAQTHKDVTIDTIKNSCDLFIPLTNLGYMNLSPSTVGLLGVISSSAGIYSILNPFAKLPLT